MERATKELKTHVNAGVIFLNAVYKNWWKKIDVDQLDLSDPNTCVLGQLFSDQVEIEPSSFWNDTGFDIGKEKFFGEEDEKITEALGFDTEKDKHYAKLTALWKAAIIKAKRKR